MGDQYFYHKSKRCFLLQFLKGLDNKNLYAPTTSAQATGNMTTKGQYRLSTLGQHPAKSFHAERKFCRSTCQRATASVLVLWISSTGSRFQQRPPVPPPCSAASRSPASWNFKKHYRNICAKAQLYLYLHIYLI